MKQPFPPGFMVALPAASAGTRWYFGHPEEQDRQFGTIVGKERVGCGDPHYRTRPRPEARALAGNSMGGHGAMFLALRHKDVFSAAAP